MQTAEIVPVARGINRTTGLSPASAFSTVIDLEGNIRYANETARMVCGLVRGYRDLKQLLELGGDGQVFLDYLRDTLQTGEHRSCVRSIEFRDLRGEECVPAQLYYLQMFPVSGGETAGLLIQPLRGIGTMTEELLEECEEAQEQPPIRVGGRSISYSGERSQR